MLVFDLPSFPYVFKVIKDYYPPQKDTTREQIKGKYLLVKQHDRVGRMADTLEYSEVAFPRDRFEDELIEEIRKFAPSQLEISDRDGDGHEEVIIKHLYIERRMIPLNIYLQEASTPACDEPAAQREQIERAVVEYGNAIKDLVAANIFPGDMLWKNFGVTRNGKVVFYDYDEIEYLTDCNFRKVPAAAQRGRRDVRRGLVLGRPARRLPRNLRALPARQPRGARGVHEAPRRPARRRLLAGAQGAHPGRPCARRVPLRARQALPAHCTPRRAAGMSARDAWELRQLRRHGAGACRSPSLFFAWEQRKERDNEEEEGYQLLSDAYNDFLKVVLANPDLHLRTNEPLHDPTTEQSERMLVIFDMLMSLFERAYLVAYKPKMSETERRRWNSWDDYMREWCRREDFHNALPLLLRGEDPEFQDYMRRIAEEERGALIHLDPPSLQGVTPCLNPSSSSAPPAPPWAASRATSPSLSAHDLGGAAIKAAVERAGIPADAVGEVLFGNCLMAGQGQAPGAPGRVQGRPAQERRRRHAVQDVRLRHEGRDVRARHAAGRHARGDGRRRHGEHDQRAATCCSRAAAATASATTRSTTT